MADDQGILLIPQVVEFRLNCCHDDDQSMAYSFTYLPYASLSTT